MVLAHAGALQEGSDASGEVIDETRQMDDAVDVVIAGHTHSRLDLEIDGKLVVQAFSYGLAFDQVRITVDRASGEVVRGSAEVVRTLHAGVRPDAISTHWSRRPRVALRRLAIGSSVTRAVTSTTRPSTGWRWMRNAPSPAPTSPFSFPATPAPTWSADPSPTPTPSTCRLTSTRYGVFG